jgi:glycine/D-amino acid oxidase-like deaminating enzyme
VADTFDLIVLGGGPAGASAAAGAGFLGKRAALVEKAAELGGAGINTGTLPSKTLRETALALSGLRSRRLFGVDLSLQREATVADFMRLYTAPGVDHVGSGAPSQVDMLQVLVDWVENGRAPGDLVVVEQQPALPIAIDRSLPLCRWPAWPHYKTGDPKSAASFVCAP